jgi:uncharacterized protein DUF1566
MKRIFRRLAVLLFLSGSCAVWAQAGATLLATTDLDCNWKLDGKPQGLLKADDSSVVAVSAGKHLVQATSSDGLTVFRTVVEVSQGQEMVEIQLKTNHQKQVEEADREQHATWTDPATGLMWTRKDNGGDVTWQQANNYCANLQLAGYSGWRSATIDELAAIFDRAQSVGGFHIKGRIWISGAPWSGSPVNAARAAPAFRFDTGERYYVNPDASVAFRALCVRRSAE